MDDHRQAGHPNDAMEGQLFGADELEALPYFDLGPGIDWANNGFRSFPNSPLKPHGSPQTRRQNDSGSFALVTTGRNPDHGREIRFVDVATIGDAQSPLDESRRPSVGATLKKRRLDFDVEERLYAIEAENREQKERFAALERKQAETNERLEALKRELERTRADNERVRLRSEKVAADRAGLGTLNAQVQAITLIETTENSSQSSTDAETNTQRSEDVSPPSTTAARRAEEVDESSSSSSEEEDSSDDSSSESSSDDEDSSEDEEETRVEAEAARERQNVRAPDFGNDRVAERNIVPVVEPRPDDVEPRPDDDEPPPPPPFVVVAPNEGGRAIHPDDAERKTKLLEERANMVEKTKSKFVDFHYFDGPLTNMNSGLIKRLEDAGASQNEMRRTETRIEGMMRKSREKGVDFAQSRIDRVRLELRYSKGTLFVDTYFFERDSFEGPRFSDSVTDVLDAILADENDLDVVD